MMINYYITLSLIHHARSTYDANYDCKIFLRISEHLKIIPFVRCRSFYTQVYYNLRSLDSRNKTVYNLYNETLENKKSGKKAIQEKYRNWKHRSNCAPHNRFDCFELARFSFWFIPRLKTLTKPSLERSIVVATSIYSVHSIAGIFLCRVVPIATKKNARSTHSFPWRGEKREIRTMPSTLSFVRDITLITQLLQTISVEASAFRLKVV